MPITPKRGSLFHAETHIDRVWACHLLEQREVSKAAASIKGIKSEFDVSRWQRLMPVHRVGMLLSRRFLRQACGDHAFEDCASLARPLVASRYP
ncbi:hypothetical protein WDM22_45210 (plasmid) [Bradyrhizobium septentrionale]|uniref:hypothetical protein n=1 Tax=Bradyrhizobium septentrionale TaxID=1404411 RepID=UPI0030D41A00